ncbi:hypothetical protein [Pseudanabaena yagii]|uniref:Uncharacterized protein n=1 Tax=Pseudanabaena yagii GIHE-NHR1 TaxID=2722753 RepID=A0ABX1LQ34_9CYAN|nr:hypothetical protein [Pseudanabaena yagii]NMF57621.1 hypothetical protein [Pseudanabaena yagii GIHE-NHR1]
MALFGLFGKKDQSNDSEKSGDSYFLDADSAKTFGDIDYMRTPKAVKKTFPTVNGVQGAKVVEIVSATEKTEGSELEVTSSKTSESAPTPKFEPKLSNTRVDSSMDIFLNMAKDIKKR